MLKEFCVRETCNSHTQDISLTSIKIKIILQPVKNHHDRNIVAQTENPKITHTSRVVRSDR